MKPSHMLDAGMIFAKNRFNSYRFGRPTFVRKGSFLTFFCISMAASSNRSPLSRANFSRRIFWCLKHFSTITGSASNLARKSAKNVKNAWKSNFNSKLIKDAVDFEQKSFCHACGRNQSTYWKNSNDQRQIFFLLSDFLEIENFTNGR